MNIENCTVMHCQHIIVLRPPRILQGHQLNFLNKLAELAEFSNQSAEFLKKLAELAEFFKKVNKPLFLSIKQGKMK